MNTKILAAPIERVLQQSVEPQLGKYVGDHVCSPACFYMVAKAYGYLRHGPGSQFADFIAALDWDHAFSAERGWMRPKLAQQLRRQFGLELVSWQLHGNQDASSEVIERMRAAGYLHTQREIDFYRQHIVGATTEELARQGYPLIAGVLPGFGRNLSAHAVVIARWDDTEVEVIDPDGRNPERFYEPDYVRANLNPNGGGCTLILPPISK